MSDNWERKFTIGTGFESARFDVDVEVYIDKRTLIAVVEREYGAQPVGTDAVTHCFTDGNDPQALIRLPMDDLSVRVIAHEAGHAAVHLAGKLLQALPPGDDETIPWLAGELTAAIWETVHTTSNSHQEAERNADD